MKKHLALTCLAYTGIGISFTVEQIGIKAGLGLYPCIAIYAGGLIFFLIVALTSMEKLKRFIRENEERTKSEISKTENQ